MSSADDTTASFKLPDAPAHLAVDLAAQAHLSLTAAAVMVARGITTADQVEQLRAPVSDADFHDPLLLGDMRAAVERIRFAIEDDQPIVVHGDYDADGMCATVVLVEALESLGANVSAFLPSRLVHGYGLSMDVVDRFAADGIRLLITVDCGITAVEQVRQAVDHGMDVIICDHHQPGAELPPAMICSTRPSDYPFPDICATVVAGKLAEALGAHPGDAAHELEALATVADCMPLIGENRSIVRRGLAAMRRTQRPGLRALMSTCDIHARSVDEEALGFKLAPRLNAAGRIDDPEKAYELLRAPDSGLAQHAAETLHRINDERRRIELMILQEAEAQIASWTDEMREHRMWVLAGDGWHEGVVGIVAARLVERYRRPVIVLGTSGSLARGSGRSIEGFDLHGAVATAHDLLVRWGGHHGAVGMTVDPVRIDELRARLATVAAERISDADMQPTCSVDALLQSGDLSMTLIEELATLAPFGQDNPRPVLLSAGAMVEEASAVGKDASHLRGRLSIAGVSAPFIAFGAAHQLPQIAARHVNVAGRVSINRFRGAETLQLDVVAIEPLKEHPGTCASECNFTCTERIEFASVLAHSSSPSEIASIRSQSDLPPLASLLDSPTTHDLRGSSVDPFVLAALHLQGGSSVVIACADVARRRTLLHAHRSALREAGAAVVTLASERCDAAGISQRLARLATTGAQFVMLVDHGAPLEHVLQGARAAGAQTLIIMDPPTTPNMVHTYASSGLHASCTWGAAETRFTLAATHAVGDIRATLGGAWKYLTRGVDNPQELEQVVFGGADAAILHAPSAVSHALNELQRRGLIDVDTSSQLISTRTPIASS